jgi:hypothetical protein
MSRHVVTRLVRASGIRPGDELVIDFPGACSLVEVTSISRPGRPSIRDTHIGLEFDTARSAILRKSDLVRRVDHTATIIELEKP